LAADRVFHEGRLAQTAQFGIGGTRGFIGGGKGFGGGLLCRLGFALSDEVGQFVRGVAALGQFGG
jgi:hypothetical protein